MPYQLYAAPDNANLVIHILLEELGQDYELIWLDRQQKAHRREAYKRLNPQGLIPTLVDGEQVVFETAAIALYLTDKHAALAPSSGPLRAPLYQWLFYLSNTLHADLRIQFYAHRHVSEASAEPALRVGTRARVQMHLQLLEAHLQSHGGPWLLGEDLSILDIYLGVMCRWMVLYPKRQGIAATHFDHLPRLRQLLEALQQRPACVRACEMEHISAPYLLLPKPPAKPSQ